MLMFSILIKEITLKYDTVQDLITMLSNVGY